MAIIKKSVELKIVLTFDYDTDLEGTDEVQLLADVIDQERIGRKVCSALDQASSNGMDTLASGLIFYDVSVVKVT